MEGAWSVRPPFAPLRSAGHARRQRTNHVTWPGGARGVAPFRCPTMQALRLTRPATLRSTARAMTVRMYSPGPEGGAGSVASSKGWHTREKAQEDQYILQHEKEKLEKRTYAPLTQCVPRCRSSRSSLSTYVCPPNPSSRTRRRSSG